MNGFIVSISCLKYHQKDDKHTFTFAKNARLAESKFENKTLKFPSFFFDNLKAALDNKNRDSFKNAVALVIGEIVGDFDWDDFTIMCQVNEVKDGLISQWSERPHYL